MLPKEAIFTGPTTRFDNRLSATTTLPNLTTLLGLTNASTTQLTTAGSTYLAISGGNVGIGTASPQGYFEVSGANTIFRISPGIDSPNILAGYSGNYIESESMSVIAGGGSLNYANTISGSGSNLATISGGYDNHIANGGSLNAGEASTIGGGGHNNIHGTHGYIGGGSLNIIDDSDYSVIPGGNGNHITESSFSVVSGGGSNTIDSSSFQYNTIIGGGLNSIGYGAYSTVLGGFNSKVSGNYSTVMGSNMTIAASNQFGANFTGGYYFMGGSIGINVATTTSLSQKLDINGAIALEMQGLTAFPSNVSYGAIFSTGAAAPYTYPFSDNGNLVLQPRTSTGGAAGIVFATGNTTPSARMVINSTGKVGVGTTSPWGLLSVNANGIAAGAPQFVIGSSTRTDLVVTQSGNVGIGTTTPSRILDISASKGNAIAAGWDVWSSEKYKNNITYLGSKDYSDILAAISGINIATYFYNGEQVCDLNSPGCHKRMGLIAEEAPREVLSATGDSISLYDLASYTLAGVKALGNQMNDMEARIKDLESKPFSQSLSALGGDNASLLASIGSAIESGLLKFQSLTSRNIVIEKTADPKNDSIGEGVIKAGETEARIESSQVKNNSKIFSTFRNDYESRWWISAQGDGFFLVKITQPLASDINFDWWVVGVVEPYIGNIDISDSSPSPTPELTESPAPIESPTVTESPAPISETPSPTPTDSPASAPEESPAPIASPTE